MMAMVAREPSVIFRPHLPREKTTCCLEPGGEGGSMWETDSWPAAVWEESQDPCAAAPQEDCGLALDFWAQCCR